jgi:hypothetical protein
MLTATAQVHPNNRLGGLITSVAPAKEAFCCMMGLQAIRQALTEKGLVLAETICHNGFSSWMIA